jgi:hypothetical protein
MNIMLKPKFKVGQEVYYCSYSSVPNTEICKTCRGLGRIEIANFDDKTISCPKCYGRGSVTSYLPTQWVVAYHPSRIGRVNTEEYSTEFLENQEYNYENSISYMLVATGVGSGTLWPEEQLHETKELAEKWCKEKNQEQN